MHATWRGTGLGTDMFAWATGVARERGAAPVQLTSDASRTSAHRCYERLGFQPTPAGFKLSL